MPSLSYQDLNINVSWGGDFHIQLRTLDEHLTKEQVAELIYPVLDAQEKALVASQKGTP
jgi:hypothetical protein